MGEEDRLFDTLLNWLALVLGWLVVVIAVGMIVGIVVSAVL